MWVRRLGRLHHALCLVQAVRLVNRTMPRGGAGGRIPCMIGRLHHVVIDCPDPRTLAAFYSELLGQPISYSSEDWVVVAENDTTSGVAFQLAPDHQPPDWPDPARPQQFHLDVMVDDVDAARPRVLALGARLLSAESNVYADPAGHPFCLIPRPAWAPPIGADDKSVGRAVSEES
jgi:catechol 2,3-dioxygenase-like lactoylglutathione lyase family enzyme